jgi:WD40 repeat protein/DNA-binding SARP family transcriptional activator/predicted ATPase
MPDANPSLAATIRCLGAFEVILGQVTITAFPTDKIRALLTYLALNGSQPHRRELLSGLLWPEMPGPLALTNLRLALHRLRQTLDEAVPGSANQLLLSTRQTIQLNPAAVTVDVAVFQALLTACNTHPHAELATCEPCLARLAEAVTHYRGELLAGFGLFDAPPFEEWLLLRRESLHQQALAALDRLILAYEQRGDHQQAHSYAGRQLAIDPSREEAHRQVMRALARLGLREQALAQFESCRRLLREQLDVDPDLETVALYEQIRTGTLPERVKGWGFDVSSAERGEAVTNQPVPPSPLHPFTPSPLHRDWGEVAEIGKVYGRQSELAQLEQWLIHARCRLVAVLGIGGVGKTTVAAATAQAVAPHFDRVLWRSLLNAPPLDELLPDILQRLADEQLVEIPHSLDRQLALLLDSLRRQRVLLVLDNLESVLHPDQPGHPRPGYAGYALLLRQIVEQEHQSCLLLTSRERPQGIGRWEEDFPAVRSLPLDGLDAAAGQAMLGARGVSGSHAEASALVERYSGNPLALKLVVQTVQELFRNDIGAFLALEAPFFDDIRTVLDQQFARLSPLEQEVLIWLAIEREPVSLTQLRQNLVEPGAPHTLLEALRALQRRSLIGQSAEGFLLQNVVIEYLTDYLVEQVTQETLDFGFGILDAEADDPLPKTQNLKSKVLNRHALLKATAKEYVRASQERLIAQPLLKRLLARLGQQGLVGQFKLIIAQMRTQTPLLPGYAAGNLLNLLLLMNVDLRGFDFSHLTVWQANLQMMQLPEVSFRGANLAYSCFTHLFGEIFAAQFDADGQLMVAGSVHGTLYVWGHVWGAPGASDDGPLLHEYHTVGANPHIASFDRNGRLLASGHIDHLVRLWDVTQGRLLRPLAEPLETIWSLLFSPNGETLVISSADGTIRLWDVQTGRLQQMFQAHRAAIPALAFTPDGQTLASGDVDGTICLWHISEHGQAVLLDRLSDHSDEVHKLAFDASGTILASGNHDRTVRLWRVSALPPTVEPLHILQGHTQPIRALAASPDGIHLASGGDDQYIRLWDVRTGQLAHSFLGLAFRSGSLTFSHDGRMLASAAREQVVFLWDVATRQRLNSLRAYSNQFYTVSFSPDGHWLAAGGVDGTLYLWAMAVAHHPYTPIPAATVRTLHGHTRPINAIAFAPTGASEPPLMASASSDQTIRLWDVASGRTTAILAEHTDNVEALQFSPDGGRLVSTSRDKSVKLWDLASGQVLHTLHGHTDRVHTCAFSPSGNQVASGSRDRTVRIWDAHSGAAVHTFHGHTNAARYVIFSPDGRLLLSTSYDHTLCFWDAQTGDLLLTLPTWDTTILCIAFHPQTNLLAFAMNNHQVHLWEFDLSQAGGHLKMTLHGHTNGVESVAFSPNGEWLASASTDETIRLWEVATGECRQILRADGPYAGMDITGATGISAGQKAVLKALGAVEEDEITGRVDRVKGWQGEGVTSAHPVTPSPLHPDLGEPEQTDTESPLPNLPRQATPFIGRTQELTAILTQLADANVRLLTLVGAGGMGKTRLAIAAAQTILDLPAQPELPGTPKSKIPILKFPDGVVFVALAAVNRASEVAISVATALGLALTGGDPRQMLIRFLQPRRLLLILDNFEHLLVNSTTAEGDPEADEKSAALLVAELLQAAPGVKILVTSRQKLNLQGEHLYPIQGMDVAQTTTLAAAAQSTSVQLFVQSAQRVQPGFVLAEPHLRPLLRICRLVEGMPLGLEMAAAWTEMLPLEEIAQEIEKSLDFLAADWPELPTRQRSMRAVFEWSWRLLRTDERQVLRQLAVFRGGFTRHAAEQVAGASLRILTSLVQKSLLRRIDSGADAGMGRYDLHELLRQFAAEQLAALPDEQMLSTARHSAYYLTFAAVREQRLARNEPKEAAREIQGEIDNVRQAWLWAAQQTILPDLNAAAYALRLYYTFISLEPEGEQLFQPTIERLRSETAPQSQALLSKLLGFQAILQLAQHKYPAALAAAQEAVRISASAPPGQPYIEGETFGHLAWGMALSLESSNPQARTLLEQALQMTQRYQPASAAGQSPIESLYDAEWVAHLSLRDLDRYEDNYPGAIAHVQQAVQLCRALDKRRGEMNGLIHLGDPLIKAHDYEGARQVCAQGLALARALNNRWGAGFSLHHLGDATRLLGRYGEALTLLEQAHTVMHLDSDLAEEAMVAALLGHLYNLMGAYEQATTWFDRFLAALQQFPSAWPEAELEGLLPLSLFRCHTGEHELALDCANRCLHLAQTYGWRQSQARALIVRGHAEVGRQQPAAAHASYMQALALCQTLNDLHLGVEAEAGLARLAVARGDLAQAQTHVTNILPTLDFHPQAGMDEPFEIYLTCHQVLAASNDPAAATVLQRGYDLLQAYARQIPDHDLRESFLNKAPVHRALHQAHLHAYPEPPLG